MSDTNLSLLRRRRGTVKSSITKLASRIDELEANPTDATLSARSQQFAKRLSTLDSEFKEKHLLVVDAVDSEEQLATEQDELDSHDDTVMDLDFRLQALMTPTDAIAPPTSGEPAPSRAILERRSAQLQARLQSMSDKINGLKDDGSDMHLVYLYQEHLTDLKRELSELRNEILVITADFSDPLMSNTQRQEDVIFDMSVGVKKLMFQHPPSSSDSTTSTTSVTAHTTPDTRGVKLPKIDVPTFDGELLHWQTFWEQFSISVDKRSDISNTEKLVYLRHSLKDGSAKNIIEGLSHSGDQYKEAIDSLKARYDRPRIIHQAHVRKIYDVPGLKDGSGKDIRRFHDVVQQHLRALKAMKEEPTGSFITALLEIKLDKETMFEWQKASQEMDGIPHYEELLKFLNLRAQAAETCGGEARKQVASKRSSPRSVAALAANSLDSSFARNCSICKTQKHPLYMCPQFKLLPHDKMLAVTHSSGVCINCLKPGHIWKNCKSNTRCKKCHKPHHTLLHIDAKPPTSDSGQSPANTEAIESSSLVTELTSSSYAQASSGGTLLMTCQMLVHAPDGTHIKARGLLDSGSSASFVSQQLAQTLRLPLSARSIRISGITGMCRGSTLQSVTTLAISPILSPAETLQLSALVVPRITCDLPTQPVHFDAQWNHLNGLHLADPNFGEPRRIDVLLGIDVYADVMLQGRRNGPPGTPIAFETKFGWVLSGKTNMLVTPSIAASHHLVLESSDDILRKFWEIEECPRDASNYSPDERAVVQHFSKGYKRNKDGRFIVPLPKNPQAKPFGESRSSAVRRFLSLERALHSKHCFNEFAAVMNEYMDLKHAELVPQADLHKPVQETFYLPMHAVRKEESTTTKLRIVFDASAKSSSGVSLNDSLLVGPTIHPSLIDVLLRFRTHCIALTTDISKMYRAIELSPEDKDLHRFVWRDDPQHPLVDYRMTRLTFGVSASSFAANMAVKQNAIDFTSEYPLAAKSVDNSFYVDDGLTGADTLAEAIELQRQLQELFSKGGFLLRKWNSSDPQAIQHLPVELKNSKPNQDMPSTDEYTKTLGIRWNIQKDCFTVVVPPHTCLETLTKRGLVSDVAKTFDALGWVSPSTIKAKIFMQQLWELKVDWDDSIPKHIHESWLQWRSELHLLSQIEIPRCYFDKNSQVQSQELHGFSDASEVAYAAVVYLRTTAVSGDVDISIVMSKSKVAPIKRLTIPRLELCGAQLLARLLHHVRTVLGISLANVFAWTDSTIVLNWLDGNPRRFKTYVGNRIATIVDLIPSDKWRHVRSAENPADCSSRGLYPSELIHHTLWWNGPTWLREPASQWPQVVPLPVNEKEIDDKETTLLAVPHPSPVVAYDQFSNFNALKRITARVFRFISNCKLKTPAERNTGFLTTTELQAAEDYLIKIIQHDHFERDLTALAGKHDLLASSPLLPFQPFIDESNLLRVRGRQQHSALSYRSRHPVIIHGKHLITRLIIRDEHLRLLHGGPTLLTASLNRRFHIVSGRNAIRSVTRKCVTCRKQAAIPKPQKLGQLPAERVTPGFVFEKVGVDYAGPVLIKYGHVRKPVIVKAYICLFVSLTVKAVHLELVTDLTSQAFLASFKRFISRRGLPSLIWSDHGTNFVGAAREIKEFYEFLRQKSTQDHIQQFLSEKKITWKFIPQHAPHFGGLWESAVKSVKTHLKRILGDVKLTYEEFSTILCQIEAVLNSRPLVPLPNDDDGIEPLTPGHFLVGKPLTALPESPPTGTVSLLKRWQLCKLLIHHFWKRWSADYLTQLGRFNKWRRPSRNIQSGDLVAIHEDSPITAKWPLARVIEVHPGKDNLVRVATVRTASGTYTRPVTKLALILPNEEC